MESDITENASIANEYDGANDGLLPILKKDKAANYHHQLNTDTWIHKTNKKKHNRYVCNQCGKSFPYLIQYQSHLFLDHANIMNTTPFSQKS